MEGLCKSIIYSHSGNRKKDSEKLCGHTGMRTEWALFGPLAFAELHMKLQSAKFNSCIVATSGFGRQHFGLQFFVMM